ncbi:MAG: Lrp/AsnC family transcriptional regulator [Gemmatimonadales bacterium]|nr:Lrp/AsnC family transcriptional regulator [Gemmatimonadales bacterium]
MPQYIRRDSVPEVVDRIDRDILAHLQHDARISNKALAAKVGLAPSSCLARVRRLERSGALLGYHAEVDPRVHGVTLEALVAVRLERHARAAISGFESHAVTLPEVRGLYHLTGANDYLVHVAVRDSDHLREFILTAFSTRPEVAHLETSLIFSHRRNPAFGTVPLRARRADPPNG